VSNLRQFQTGRINFTAKLTKFKIIALKNQPKSTKFKQNLTKLCCFLLVCWLVGLLAIYPAFMVFYRLNIHLLLH